MFFFFNFCFLFFIFKNDVQNNFFFQSWIIFWSCYENNLAFDLIVTQKKLKFFKNCAVSFQTPLRDYFVYKTDANGNVWSKFITSHFNIFWIWIKCHKPHLDQFFFLFLFFFNQLNFDSKSGKNIEKSMNLVQMTPVGWLRKTMVQIIIL